MKFSAITQQALLLETETLSLPSELLEYSHGIISFKWRSNISEPILKNTWTLADIINPSWYSSGIWYNVTLSWVDDLWECLINGATKDIFILEKPFNISDLLLGSDYIKDIEVLPMASDSVYSVILKDEILYSTNGWKLTPEIDFSKFINNIDNAYISWEGDGSVEYNINGEWISLINGQQISNFASTMQFRYSISDAMVSSSEKILSNINFTLKLSYLINVYSNIGEILSTEERDILIYRDISSYLNNITNEYIRESSNMRLSQTFSEGIDTDSSRVTSSNRTSENATQRISSDTRRRINLNIHSLTTMKKIRSKVRYRKTLTKKAEFTPMRNKIELPKLVIDLPEKEVHIFNIKKPPLDI